GHEGSPLVSGSTMYIHTPFPNNVFALDLDDENKILWKDSPKQDPSVISVMCCDTVNRGVAYGDGKILLYQADTTVVALHADTGTIASRGASGTWVAGISGAESPPQRHLTAYAIAPGKPAWRGYNVGPDDRILFEPAKTPSPGNPAGPDSSITTWNADPWQI